MEFHHECDIFLIGFIDSKFKHFIDEKSHDVTRVVVCM